MILITLSANQVHLSKNSAVEWFVCRFFNLSITFSYPNNKLTYLNPLLLEVINVYFFPKSIKIKQNQSNKLKQHSSHPSYSPQIDSTFLFLPLCSACRSPLDFFYLSHKIFKFRISQTLTCFNLNLFTHTHALWPTDIIISAETWPIFFFDEVLNKSSRCCCS